MGNSCFSNNSRARSYSSLAWGADGQSAPNSSYRSTGSLMLTTRARHSRRITNESSSWLAVAPVINVITGVVVAGLSAHGHQNTLDDLGVSWLIAVAVSFIDRFSSYPEVRSKGDPRNVALSRILPGS